MAVAYPFLSHAAVWWAEPLLQWLALSSLISIPLMPFLARRRLWAWMLLPGLAVGLRMLVLAGDGFYALYLPSVLIPALFGWMFGASLRGSGPDYITAMAEATRESMTPDLRAYTRRLTQLWTALFVLMAFGSLLLALLGERMLWSILSNGVNYLLCAGMFIGDHYYRRWRYRADPHPGFIEYLRIVAHAGPRRT